MSEPTKCPNCGKPIFDGDDFCHLCRLKVKYIKGELPSIKDLFFELEEYSLKKVIKERTKEEFERSIKEDFENIQRLKDIFQQRQEENEKLFEEIEKGIPKEEPIEMSRVLREELKIIFDTYEEANYVLSKILNMASDRGYVSFSDVNTLVNNVYASSKMDSKYGWTKEVLNKASITEISSGNLLRLPAPKRIRRNDNE